MLSAVAGPLLAQAAASGVDFDALAGEVDLGGIAGGLGDTVSGAGDQLSEWGGRLGDFGGLGDLFGR